MNHWNNILTNSDANFNSEGDVDFPDNIADSATESLLVFPLVKKDILQISGPDSKKFLQGQATCNLDELSEQCWTPGAICDPKGRMFTSFSLYQPSEQQLLLEMNAGLAQITLDAINKYSAFFKTDLEDSTQSYGVIGLMGKSSSNAVEQILGVTLGAEVIQHDGCLVIPLEEQRIKLLIPADKLASIWQAFAAIGTPCSNLHWDFIDIQRGIGEVSESTSGELIPQMINLQARGGISFKKGCYTGQEIVARMKYLGKLKRRMYRLQLSSNVLPEAGQPCFSNESDSKQGIVVSAAKTGEKAEVLVVMTENLAGENQIIIAEQPLQRFDSLPLPYSLD